MVKLFNPSGNPVRWDYVLYSAKHTKTGKLKKVPRKMRDVCKYLIVDSGYKRPDITNWDVITTAARIDADCVVPKDYPGEDYRKTVDSVNEFFESCEWEKDILIPLQASYPKCYDAVAHHDAFGNWFGLGGMVGLHPEVQFNLISGFLAHIRKLGHEIKIHLFGVYPRHHVMQLIHANLDLIHSIDTSVCESAAITGDMLDFDQARCKLPHTTGKHQQQWKYRRIECNLTLLDILLNYPDAGEETGQKGKAGNWSHLKHAPKKEVKHKKLTEWVK